MEPEATGRIRIDLAALSACQARLSLTGSDPGSIVKLRRMKSTSQRFGRPLRAFASLTLALWFGAQVLCLIHCSFGGGHSEAKAQIQSGCQNCGASNSGNAGKLPPVSAMCLTLKLALVDSESPAISPPSHVLYVTEAVELAEDAASAVGVLDRQLWRTGPVDTVEVCLGSAHRSLAPPLHASLS